MKRRASAVAAVGLAFTFPARGESASREVAELVAWLSGTFDSTEQADLGGEAPAARMVTVQVPKSLLAFGAPVLYREEATVENPDRPFRQRFLRIEEDAAGTILVRVFELKDPIVAAGKWREASDLGLFGKNDVRERDGCLVTLRRVGDRYEGGTTGIRCVSSVRGAAYATSETKIWKDRIETWDRGFDADRKQVWGPVKGPTRFVKRSTGFPGETVASAAAAPASAPPVARAEGSTAVPARPAAAPPPGVDVLPVPDEPHDGDVSLVGAGPTTWTSSKALRTDHAATTVRQAAGGGAYRGVPLAALLSERGIPSDGPAARRVLASAVLLATGADDSVSVFSGEELFLSKDWYLIVFEKDAQPLGEDGPLMLLDVKSPTRTVRRLRSLEWRNLAALRSGGAEP